MSEKKRNSFSRSAEKEKGIAVVEHEEGGTKGTHLKKQLSGLSLHGKNSFSVLGRREKGKEPKGRLGEGEKGGSGGPESVLVC